jgi:ribonucleoside-triphosphate reductase
LRSNIDEHEYHNSFGAGSTKIGSLGVCTINMPRVAYLAIAAYNHDTQAGAQGIDKGDYFLGYLDSFVKSATLVNLAKLELIQERIKEKALPLYDYGFINIKSQYLTVGVNGMAEACEILGIPVMHEGYSEAMGTIIDRINANIDKLNEHYRDDGIKFNVEQTPSENSAIKLAAKDYFMGFNRAEDGTQRWPLYSNQFIPLTYKANLLDRITIQGELDNKFSGGAICHLNIEQRVSDPAKLYELIRICARKGVVYWAANYCLQECENGHMSVGKAEVCPECSGAIVNEYSRVVGFLTNVKHWHEVRRGDADWNSRLFY